MWQLVAEMRRALIGIGQAGIDIVDNLKDRVAIDTIAIDMEKYAVHSSAADQSIHINEEQIEDVSTLRIHHNIHIDAIGDVEPIIDSYDIIYIVGALGGRAGGVLVPAVAKEALDLGKDVRGKIILPFQVEEEKREIAEVYLDQIDGLFHDLDVYDNQEYVSRSDEEVTLDSVYSLNSIFEEINRDILREIQRDLVYEERE